MINDERTLAGPWKVLPPSPPLRLPACTWLASYSVQLPETPLRILCHGNDGPFANAALMLFLRTWIYDLANYGISFVTNIDMTIGHFDARRGVPRAALSTSQREDHVVMLGSKFHFEMMLRVAHGALERATHPNRKPPSTPRPGSAC